MKVDLTPYRDFCSRSKQDSKNYNPNTGAISIPTLAELESNNVKFMSAPVSMDEDGTMLVAVSRMYNGFKFVDWSDWSHVLSVVHRQFNGGFDQYIVRGVLKGE